MQRLPILEAIIAGEAAGLEGVHGDLETALVLFDAAMDSQFRAGNVANLARTVANLARTVTNKAVLFDRLAGPEIAATIYGTSTRGDVMVIVIGLPEVLEHLRSTLGDTTFDDCVATGASDGTRRSRAVCPGPNPSRPP